MNRLIDAALARSFSRAVFVASSRYFGIVRPPPAAATFEGLNVTGKHSVSVRLSVGMMLVKFCDCGCGACRTYARSLSPLLREQVDVNIFEGSSQQAAALVRDAHWLPLTFIALCADWRRFLGDKPCPVAYRLVQLGFRLEAREYDLRRDRP